MSDSFVGATPELLRKLGKTYEGYGHDLHSMITKLNTETDGSHDIWRGPRADDFRQQWTTAKPTFTKMADELTEAGKFLQTHADEQARLSAK